jgi:acetyl-CoA carboxylase biotin carboxylase subunit
MFDTVLVANRGEIARRIIRTCRDMGLRTVAIHSDFDRHAPFVREADDAVSLGAGTARDTYLAVDRIIEAAVRTGAGAIHPGYGFLSENGAFAEACQAAGLTFIGPSPEAMRAMGSKRAARALMEAHGVPIVPGYHGEDQDDASFVEAARGIGYPILVKASAGGGGKGMRLVHAPEELPEALAAARREARAAFGDDSLLLERYVDSPRHIEVQILGDHHGNVVHLFERECSVQRRHQKVLEESPSPAVDDALREALGATAVKVARAIGYASAGTVEFVVGRDRAFYFLEVNTRLQVEHPVTELVTGLDLVRLQISVALGAPLPFRQHDLRQTGSAIEARLYAECPERGFLPQAGTLAAFHLEHAPGVRLDAGVLPGDAVGLDYDPLLAKVIAWGADRHEATRRLRRALERSLVVGVETNLDFLVRVLRHPAWVSGELDTHFIATHSATLLRAPIPDDLLSDAVRIATALVVTRQAAARAILPGLTPGWRNHRVRDPELAWARVDGATMACAYRVAPSREFWTSVGGEARSLGFVGVPTMGGEIRVRIGDRMRAVRVSGFEEADARGDAPCAIRIEGHTVVLRPVDPFARVESRSAARACRAPMTGRVVALRVAAGDAVEAGDVLVVLEAMKMEHALEAPQGGVVCEVLCEVGAVVTGDQELVRFEA